MRSFARPTEKPITSSKEVYSRIRRRMGRLEVEHFVVLHLDAKHRMEHLQVVSQGTRTECLVHPREVFCEAVRRRAVAVIACHNHPSGEVEPSTQDFDLTTRLYRAGELLGIPLLDHLIVGADSYLSMADIGFVGSTATTAAENTRCSSHPLHGFQPLRGPHRGTESGR